MQPKQNVVAPLKTELMALTVEPAKLPTPDFKKVRALSQIPAQSTFSMAVSI